MRVVATVVAAFAVLAVLSSPVLAHDWPSVPYHPVKHHHHLWGIAVQVPAVVAPAPVYAYPSYPPPVAYPPPPQVVYPAPVYSAPPPYYYGYPRGYVGYRGRGLSIGLGF
jgi:hypothetical protein